MNTIVITGASSGLGEALAVYFASKGWRVGAAARRLDRLEDLKARFPDNIVTAQIDVTSPDAPDRLVQLIGELGGMEIYLHAAGMGHQNAALDPDIERKTVLTNCLGFTEMVSAAYRWFRDNPTPRATIAAITSVARTKGLGMAATYSASKRYDSTYIDALDQLSHIQGVKVSFVDLRPGFIDTDLLRTDTNRYPMLMKKQYAVALIARAIEKRRRVATIDWRWRLLTAAWSMLPRWVWARFKAKTKSL